MSYYKKDKTRVLTQVVLTVLEGEYKKDNLLKREHALTKIKSEEIIQIPNHQPSCYYCPSSLHNLLQPAALLFQHLLWKKAFP